MAKNNNPFDPNDRSDFLRSTIEQFRRSGEPGRMFGQIAFNPDGPVREDTEMRKYSICACGNPDCGDSSAEAQEASRAGLFLDEDRRRMREMARDVQKASLRNGGAWPDTFNYASDPGRSRPDRYIVDDPTPTPTPTPAQDLEEKKLDELREAVAEWIVEAPEVGFDDIIGNEEALEGLRDAIRAPVEEAELYELYGMAMPKGALLSGPPGCGKTMFAKAAASEMAKLYGTDVEMLAISGTSIQQPFVGVTEKYISSMFAFARQYRKVNGHPLLIFIDEAEVLFPDRTGRVRKVAPWEESQVATFLAEMDGMETCGAFVLLASNRPEVIDSALLRDGRCDFKIQIARPTAEALEGILARNFRGIFTAEKEETLVFNAVEGFLDPHKVLLDFHDMVRAMEGWFEARGLKITDEEAKKKMSRLKTQRFGFEHIVNGAMAAGVPMRAKRKAFSRDRKNGTQLGVIGEDVTAAVSDIFEENKDLDHSYAMQEFMKGVTAELEGMG